MSIRRWIATDARRVAAVVVLVLAGCGGDRPPDNAFDPAAPALEPVDAAPPQGWSHEVRPGDTLWDVARRYGTTTDAIVRANGLAEPDALEVGEVLTIPPPPPPLASPSPSEP